MRRLLYRLRHYPLGVMRYQTGNSPMWARAMLAVCDWGLDVLDIPTLIRMRMSARRERKALMALADSIGDEDVRRKLRALFKVAR